MSRRLQLLTASLLLIWGMIAGRLIHLQLTQHLKFSDHAISQQTYDERIPARLGDIVDRNGHLLATSSTCLSLYVDPSRLNDPSAFAARVAKVLELDEASLITRIEAQRSRQFLWVQRRLSNEDAEAILNLELPGKGWGLREELRRVYPHQTLAAHILGWRNIDGVPQAGLEKSLNQVLQGVDGSRTLVRDARGYVIEVLEEVTQPPRHGSTVVLTLDADVQRAAELRLDELVQVWQPRSASAVVLDPQTGEILAMASRPTFDPAAPSTAPTGAWTNPIVSSAFEPGSTIKPCLAAWAIDQNIVSREETFSCLGTYQMGTRLLHDHRAFGKLDLTGIITHSSNIGMAQIGQRMGNDRLYAAVRAFGFGRKTGIELPGEAAGIVRPLERWDDYSTGSVPMGQELAVTPLQMVTAHAALANGGRWLTPHLVLHLSENDPQPLDVLSTSILSEDIAQWMTTGPLVNVVERGTARRAAINGINVFAKTGTAQKYDAESGAYSDTRYVSSCICGAPAEAPRVLVMVTVDETSTADEPAGGKVAAPAASDILKAALNAIQSSSPSQRLLQIAKEKLGPTR
ncbi:MAG: penicillin-binding protein 2 [Planctomycetaceae bacterium]|nr:penicillin-binding protein 2 [Planctomycetaceae bacterium]